MSNQHLRHTSRLIAVISGARALVPPGYCLLFVVDSEGIPSKAKFVRVS